MGVLAIMVPPFQKSDEPGHYYRAVSLANGDLVCQKDADGFYYFAMKKRDAEAPLVFHVWDVALQGDQRFDRAWLKADFSDPHYDEIAHVRDYCNLPPIGYIPSALGVFIGKPFESPLFGIYAGRILGGLLFVAGLIWALKVVPERYRLVVYFFAAAPMILHQVTAISYDTTQFALFPVLFAYLARFIVQGTPQAKEDDATTSSLESPAVSPSTAETPISDNPLAVDGEGAGERSSHRPRTFTARHRIFRTASAAYASRKGPDRPPRPHPLHARHAHLDQHPAPELRPAARPYARHQALPDRPHSIALLRDHGRLRHRHVRRHRSTRAHLRPTTRPQPQPR